MKRILTPEEVDALSMPAVQREIALINDGLITGKRIFMVDNGLLPRVIVAFEAEGWQVDVCEGATFGIITVKPRPN